MSLHPLSKAAVDARMELEAAGLKRCPECGQIKERSAFHASANKRDGLQARCKSCARARQAAYNKANKDRRTQAHRKWVAANQRRWQEYMAEYRKSPERRAKHAARAAAYRATPSGGLKNRIVSRIYALLNGSKGGKRTEALVGWTIAELRTHLERQFLPGMGWQNMGQWHIDHIVPLASFTITGPDDPELRRAWALTNLRPLWAEDNIRKGAKVEVLL